MRDHLASLRREQGEARRRLLVARRKFERKPGRATMATLESAVREHDAARARLLDFQSTRSRSTLSLATSYRRSKTMRPQPIQTDVVQINCDTNPVTIITRRWASEDVLLCDRCAACSAVNGPDGQAMCTLPIPDHVPAEDIDSIVVPDEAAPDKRRVVQTDMICVPYDLNHNKPIDWSGPMVHHSGR
jgi:hypothetical protein